MTHPMNLGANPIVVPKFARPARLFMSERELIEWRALNSFTQGSNNLMHLANAKLARTRVSGSECDFGRYERSERKAILRRARPNVQRLCNDVLRAASCGNETMTHRAALRYFTSFDAKFLACSKAWETMRKSERPHIGALKSIAASLNPFKLEFETAKLSYKSRDWETAGNDKNRAPRAILNFGIRHRARHQMLLKLLQTCAGEKFRDDQYCVTAKGREAAIVHAMRLLQNPSIQFVAECDVRNFFPTVGESRGPFGAAQTLQDQFSYIPRAVIESTVLSSGVIAEQSIHQSLEVLSHFPYARTGMSMGSSLSSFLAEHIMSNIMSDAETLQPQGTELISYVDNIGVFGEDADEVNGMIEPLTVSARNSPFGSFDLLRSQTTRHKSQGFIFLGYYLKSDDQHQGLTVDVSDRNKTKFQNKLDRALADCVRQRRSSTKSLEENKMRVIRLYLDWQNSFRLAPDIGETTRVLFLEVLEQHDLATVRYFRDKLTSDLGHSALA